MILNLIIPNLISHTAKWTFDVEIEKDYYFNM